MRISRLNKARVVITMGDPSGIGPEVTLKALASPEVKGLADFLVVGETFAEKASLAAGRASLEYIDEAIAILNSGRADALVTAPVNKALIRKAGYPDFQGHTEYLAKKTGTKNFAMMFVGGDLKVVPVTRHVRLGDVPRLLTKEKIFGAIELTHKSLKKYFRVKSPKIAVCGLNPHAGENGAFGDEEKKIIIPAVKKAGRTMSGIIGPLPSDAVFYAALNKKYDAVIAMYHDQALAPFKMLYFDKGVNMTIGLKFIRTSPDHGTAFDIAGRGVADPGSMIEAIKLACRLQRCSQKVN